MNRTKTALGWMLMLGTFVLTTSIMASSVAAQMPMRARGPGGPGGGVMLGVPLHALNLTPDQQSQARSILSTYRASTRPIVDQLRQAHASLSDKLLTSGQVQTADIQSQLQQISQLRGQLLQLSAQATVDIRNLLTPDQLTSAAQTKDKLRDLQSQIHQLLGAPQH